MIYPLLHLCSSGCLCPSGNKKHGFVRGVPFAGTPEEKFCREKGVLYVF